MPALFEASLPAPSGSLPRWPLRIVTTVWAVLLVMLLVYPFLTASPSLDDDLTRSTARLSMAYYAAATVLMLGVNAGDWLAQGRAFRLARCLWALSWLGYLIHLAVAFHFYHHWSHSHAVEHVEQASGVGEGIYVSHLFTLIWTLDVAWWWLAPQRYATRPQWLGWLLHGFMAFVVFNGTVVYETGPIRWGGIVYFTAAALLLMCRLASRVYQHPEGLPSSEG